MLFAVALAAALSSAPLYREFKDWTLTCDNTRTCVLKAIPDELHPNGQPADADTLGFTITREAGPAGKLTVDLGVDDGEFDAATLRLDGKPIRAPWTGGDDAASLEGAAAAAFVRAIRDGKVLSAGAPKGGPAASLQGFAATLIATDEAQGRLGTATALAYPGAKPAGSVPPAPALPVVIAAPAPPPLKGGDALAKAVRRSHQAELKAHDCEADRASDDEAEPLTAGEAIVTLGCSMGAYQGPVLAFRTPRDAPAKARLLILPTPPGQKPPSKDWIGMYTSGGYDPASASFSESAKGRGIGDCGASTGWTFDGQAFHVSDYAEQPRCGGGMAHDWPTLYRTRTVKAKR